MTVSVNSRKREYDGNGVATSFNGPMAFEKSHIKAFILRNGISSEIPAASITVDRLGNNLGTRVALSAAPAVGDKLTILRVVPYAQDTDITNQGAFLPETLEGGLDEIVMQVQQIADRQELALHLPEPYPGTAPNMQLPLPSANKAIGWNYDATGLVNMDLTGPGDLLLRTNLADPAGGGRLVAYKRPEAGSVPRNEKVKLDEIPASVLDFNAATAAANNLTAINSAIAALPRGASLYVPDGTFKVSGPLTNPSGVRLIGPGKVVAPVPASQLNTHRYEYPIFINLEQFWRVFQVPALTNRALRVYTYGDSTVEGGFNYIDWPFFLQQLLPDMASAMGYQNAFQVTNRGVGGSNLSTFNPLPDTGVNSATPGDCFIIKYGINDAFPEETRVDVFEQRLRAGLAAIRATSGGDYGSLSILLVSPNPVWDLQFDARNTRWFEQLRPIFEAAARDYDCAFFDAYALIANASKAPGRWLDLDPANGSGVHPTNIGQSWIWGTIMDEMLGGQKLHRYRTNQFHNRSNFRGWPKAKMAPDWYPSNYAPGVTWEIADVADGFPITGVLQTEKHADGVMFQNLFPVDGTFGMLTRTARSSDNLYSSWKGTKAAVTLGFNGWTAFGGVFRGPAVTAGHDGTITLSGLMKPGTLSANVKICELPSGYRPVNQQIMLTAGDTGPCQLEILADGSVLLKSYTGTPTYVSLSGLTFFP